MLWYKGWLETRMRLLTALAFTGFYLAVGYSMRKVAPPPGASPVNVFALGATIFVGTSYTWLAGAGIATQASFQATKGLHGSTLCTLSLPVSRFRLLAVRASLGWLQMAGVIAIFCWTIWLVIPVLKGSVPAFGMFEYIAVLITCASSLYSLSVLLATFLDEMWRMWGGMIAFGALWLLSSYVRLPASLNIIRAMMGAGSPLLLHTMPWNTMAFSVASAAGLFFAALKIVQVREY